MDVSQEERAPQEVIDALVRGRAIWEESERLDREAQALRDSTSLYDVARLGHIEKRMGELLAEMKEIDVRTRHVLDLPPRKRKRSRIFSWLGLGKATLSIVGVLVSFATNPIIVLVVVLALFYETHAIGLS